MANQNNILAIFERNLKAIISEYEARRISTDKKEAIQMSKEEFTGVTDLLSQFLNKPAIEVNTELFETALKAIDP